MQATIKSMRPAIVTIKGDAVRKVKVIVEL